MSAPAAARERSMHDSISLLHVMMESKVTCGWPFPESFPIHPSSMDSIPRLGGRQTSLPPQRRQAKGCCKGAPKRYPGIQEMSSKCSVASPVRGEGRA